MLEKQKIVYLFEKRQYIYGMSKKYWPILHGKYRNGSTLLGHTENIHFLEKQKIMYLFE